MRDHDIALVKLAQPVGLTHHTGFICLPDADPPMGTLCTVTGWGHLQYGAGISPHVLYSAQVPLVSRRYVVNGTQCASKQELLITN